MSEQEVRTLSERDFLTNLDKVTAIEQLLKDKKELSEQDHITYRDYLLESWEQSKVALGTAKESEMNKRKAFVTFAFDPNKKSGTEHIELANGYQAKAVKKINYNLNQDLVNDCLDAIENIGGAEGKIIAERLVSWKADLSMTEYKLLDPKYKVLIDKAITTTDGAPSLEIVAPKNTKKL